MPMKGLGFAAGLALALLVPCDASAQEEELPFVGVWDCEVATFTFFHDFWNNGTDDIPIQETQENTDGSYTLFSSDEEYVTVGDFTPDSMTWLSGQSGDSFSCRRID
ncbi:hypothetical protein [Mangrovicella endophytica]|uniref:hypothetical protein n=1 Tax=Mangrovicella endophytica TaxID=2066697 RepID=UPI000C9E160A|nr:hypothetical protein [Mangrovicella endophytica]